jgi:hypothetical protein
VTPATTSPRHLNGKAKTSGSVCYALVVGDDGPQLISDELCGGKVDRVKASQLNVRGQRRSAIEQLGAQQDLIEA